ncbi:hypothetical protein AVEN_90631-1 [Araneus ventricosus]|uniref:Uncharacterized protein n=1 Tax=Araneus ventricosus TaxID=182803 RepID=A0A4Y2NRB8_ARAVE|nr:hypothetical protein AVEN_90631-1 [Araneus ventricosus]
MATRRWAGGPLIDENGEVVGRRGRNSRGNWRGTHNNHKSSPNSNSPQDDWSYVGHKGRKFQPSNVTQAPSHSIDKERLDVNRTHQSSDKQEKEIEHNISSYSTSDESSHKPLARKETIPSLEKSPSPDTLTNARSPNLVTPSEVGAPSSNLTTHGILDTYLSLDISGKPEFLDTLDERESWALINSLREIPIQLNPRVLSKEEEILALNKTASALIAFQEITLTTTTHLHIIQQETPAF